MLEARVGIELPGLLKIRKLFILRFVESYKTYTNAELRIQGVHSWLSVASGRGC